MSRKNILDTRNGSADLYPDKFVESEQYVCCTDDCLQEVMQQPEPAIALVNLPSFSHIVRQFKASGSLTNMFVM